MKKRLSILIGFFMVIGSITASIRGFPYWYSFYVTGAFMFFGALDKPRSVYSLVLRGEWKRFAAIYCVTAMFGLFVDIIYGRLIGSLWHYPHLSGIWGIVVPVLIFYPFGGLQVYEIFYFVLGKASRLRPTGFKLPARLLSIIASAQIALLAIGMIAPLILFALDSPYANELLIMIMILVTFSFDALYYRIRKESILFEMIGLNRVYIIAFAVSWLTAVILTEVPNVFSWEWVYTFPIGIEIFRINIIVFTFGWFFLVMVPVRIIDIVKLQLRHFTSGPRRS
ncbi:MAG: hypothetical protein ABH879_01325 [archaeon]